MDSTTGAVVGENAGAVFAKLAKVMAEVHRVPKNGRNSFQNYDYATESDAADTIRPLLAQNGLGLIVSIDSVREVENGRILVHGTITIGDESGGWLRASIAGEARDVDRQGARQDKGTYKAITGAVKYWLFKTFLLSTGDDPETDAGNPQTTQAAPPVQPPDDSVLERLHGELKALRKLASDEREKANVEKGLKSRDPATVQKIINYFQNKAAA